MRREIESPPQESAEPKQEAIGIPIDLVNEQVLIIASCLDVKTRKGLVQRLKPDTFIGAQHQIIWEGLTEIVRRDLDFDVVTLSQVTNGKVDVQYITNLLQNRTQVPPNLKHHAEMLMRDKARVECARGPVQGLLKGLADPSTPLEKLVVWGKSIVNTLSTGGGHRPIDPMKIHEKADKLLDPNHTKLIPYNLPGLDFFENGERRAIPGAVPGMITTVTGVSGCGKTSLCMHLALAQGPGIKAMGLEGLGRRVMYGSYETDSEILSNQMAALSLGIDRNRLFDPEKLTPEERIAIHDEREHILSYIKFQHKPPNDNVKGYNDQAIINIYGQIVDSGCEVVFLDLWERLFSFDNREAEERRCLTLQQQMAKDLGVHIFLAAQQTLKVVEARPDKRPTRDTIKGSSAWVDISDTIIGTNLPHMWKASLDPNKFEAIFLKQRYGKPPPLMCVGDYDEKTGLITNFKTLLAKQSDGGLDDLLSAFGN